LRGLEFVASQQLIAALDEGRRPSVLGGTDELIRMLRGVQDLRRGEPSDVSEFFGFSNWNEIIELSKSAEGDHFRTLVRLVEAHGEKKLIFMLGQTSQSEEASDLTISTAHKAKGREWRTVRLIDDFVKSKPEDPNRLSDEPPPLDPAEVRLFYVAMTRAKEAVEIPNSALSLFGIPAGPRRPLEIPEETKKPHLGTQFPRSPPRRPEPVLTATREPQRQPKPEFSFSRWWWLIPAGGILIYWLQ
jgi:hypothetical protein